MSVDASLLIPTATASLLSVEYKGELLLAPPPLASPRPVSRTPL